MEGACAVGNIVYLAVLQRSLQGHLYLPPTPHRDKEMNVSIEHLAQCDIEMGRAGLFAGTPTLQLATPLLKLG